MLPRNSLQVENGVGVELRRKGYTADLPENFVRLGVTDRLEVRFLNGNLIDHPPDNPTDPAVPNFQTADSAVSLKVLLDQPNRVLPRSAILSLNLPTGGVSQTSGSYDPSVTVIWAQNLPRGFSLSEVVQATLSTLNAARRPVWAPSVGAGYALSRTIGLFAEYAPNLAANHDLSNVFDGGLTYAYRTTQQFDVRAGYMADANGGGMLLTVGYSRRYDHFLFR